MSRSDESAGPARQSLASVIASVVASMFGVQSSRKHEEDFDRGKASTYIVVGFVATVLFVLTVWGVVQLVVRSVQPS